MMITDERKKALEDLAFKASIAGNEDCVSMSEEAFAEEFEEEKDTIIYHEFIKQRKNGFENYASLISEEIEVISSPEELHFMACLHNYEMVHSYSNK